MPKSQNQVKDTTQVYHKTIQIHDSVHKETIRNVFLGFMLGNGFYV